MTTIYAVSHVCKPAFTIWILYQNTLSTGALYFYFGNFDSRFGCSIR